MAKIDDPLLMYCNTFVYFSYLYGGDLPSCISFEEADNLMMISEKYNVRGLAEVCRCLLIKKMSVDNLYRGAILGHLYDDEILKDAAMQKLVRSGKSMKGIQGWKELKKYPELAFEVFEFYSQSMKSGSCQPPPAKRCRLQLEFDGNPNNIDEAVHD